MIETVERSAQGNDDQRAIRDLLREVFRNTADLRLTRITEGVSTSVYRIDCADERFYLRILPEEGATFAPEVRVHQLARAAGASVPEVLYYEACNETFQRSVMLTTEIPGRALDAILAQEDTRTIVTEAGRDLARINSIAVDGFGWIRRDAGDVPVSLAAEHSDLRSFASEYIEADLDILQRDVLSHRQLAELRAILRHFDALLDDSDARLAHGDFDTSHIFADASGYTGIIDFGEIRGAQLLYDLAHHHLHDGERLPFPTLPFLLEGYSDITPLPPDATTQIRFISLLIAIRVLGRMPPQAPDHPIVTTAQFALQRDMAILNEGTG